jgi:hypothetical protein
MKSRILSLFAVCATVAFALGSNGAQSATTTVVAPSANRAAPNPASLKPPGSPLSGEVLTARNVQVTPSCPNIYATFTVAGKARGPYPGTFTASGLWHSIVGKVAYFSESFTITSGTITISGSITGSWEPLPPMPMTCHYFGPADAGDGLKYSSGSASGIVTTGRIKSGHLSEKLL